MSVLIYPTVLELGEIASSRVQDLEGKIEFLFKASSSALALTSLARVLVKGRHGTNDPFRIISSFLLTDTQEVNSAIEGIPPQILVEAECLSGKVLFSAEVINRDVPTVPGDTVEPGDILIAAEDGAFLSFPSPGPSHYFGTDNSGNLGYFLLPSGGATNQVSNETPTGGRDGVNAEFTLITLPSPEQSLHLSKNGILMREGTGEDFVLSSATITYQPDAVPQAEDTHVASYSF